MIGMCSGGRHTFLAACTLNEIDAAVAWHGGEPTLAGIDFYKRVVELEKKYLPKGWEVWNNLQTNGLLLNDEWCRFLRSNRFDVGVSIDGNGIEP